MALKKSQRSLREWTKQKWRTKSAKKIIRNRRKVPPREKAIKALSASEYARTTRKREKILKKANNIQSNQRKLQEKQESIEK